MIIKKDIIIIGAGPAGLSCSLSVKNKSVLLLEKRVIGHAKLCGGLLSSTAYGIIKSFLPNKLEWGDYPSVEIDMELGGVVDHSVKFYNIDRGPFELSLKEQLNSNIEVIEEAKYKIEIINNYPQVTMNNGTVYRGEYLVVSDGVNSRYRKLVTDIRLPRILTRQLTVNGIIERSRFIFNKNITPEYYIWIIPKGNHWVIGSSDSDEFDDVKEFLIRKYSDIPKPQIIKDEYFMLTKLTDMEPVIWGKDSIFLLGEAAGLVSPTSGEGLTSAIESGNLLGNILSENYVNKDKYIEYIENKKRKLSKDLELSKQLYIG